MLAELGVLRIQRPQNVTKERHAAQARNMYGYLPHTPEIGVQ